MTKEEILTELIEMKSQLNQINLRVDVLKSMLTPPKKRGPRKKKSYLPQIDKYLKIK